MLKFSYIPPELLSEAKQLALGKIALAKVWDHLPGGFSNVKKDFEEGGYLFNVTRTSKQVIVRVKGKL